VNLVAQAIARITGRAGISASLAQLAGANQRLADNLKRHAELGADAPALRDGLAQLAEVERTDAQVLHDLTLADGVQPLAPRGADSQGANHWERLSADLVAQVELVRGLNDLVARSERSRPDLAKQLRGLVADKERASKILRDLTLKCDPQAFD